MRKPRRSLLSEIFSLPLWLFVTVAAGAGWATFELKGPEVVGQAIGSDFHLFVFIMPRIIGGMFLAGLLQVVLPPDLVAKWVGAESGLRGLVIATMVGALTPGGPMTSFPVVVAFYMSGADRGALVAYLAGWSMFGFQRMLVWELPLMGSQMALYRLSVVVLLPIVAGLIARRLPIDRIGPEPSPDGDGEGDGR